MPDPYLYVRAITLVLGAIWSVRLVLRLLRFLARWGERLEELGLERPWLKRQLRILTLRTTVLDPVNLALILVLVVSWSVRAWFV